VAGDFERAGDVDSERPLPPATGRLAIWQVNDYESTPLSALLLLG
jgi:hypothetical protein